MKIPVIDIAPLLGRSAPDQQVNATITAIRQACIKVGFFYVENHEVPKAHLKAVLDQTRAFFALSEAEKMQIHMGKSGVFRGFTPIAVERTNDKRDWIESVDFGLDLPGDHPDVLAGKPLQGSNQWPDYPSTFKETLQRHWDYMVHVGGIVTEGLALSLGLGRDGFKPFTSKSHHSMRILHYPPRDDKPSDDIGEGIGEHVDYGFVTVLMQDDIGGLEVKTAEGDWIAAPYIPGTFVINVGLMMQRWTNDLYQATPHRVRARRDKHRYSLPFFFEPDFETVVTPLPECCSDDNPARYTPFHFGEYIHSKLSTSYTDNLTS